MRFGHDREDGPGIFGRSGATEGCAYWIEEGQSQSEPHNRSAYQAARDGYVSMTPLRPVLTACAALPHLEELSLGIDAEVR